MDAVCPFSDEEEGDGWHFHHILKEARVQRRDRCVHSEGAKVSKRDNSQACAICQECTDGCTQEEE